MSAKTVDSGMASGYKHQSLGSDWKEEDKDMFNIGMPELIIIAIVALFVVGPKKLPELARSLGKGFNEFKKAAEDMTDSIKDTIQADDKKDRQGPETDKNHDDTSPA